jgi:hypothetical protein
MKNTTPRRYWLCPVVQKAGALAECYLVTFGGNDEYLSSKSKNMVGKKRHER